MKESMYIIDSEHPEEGRKFLSDEEVKTATIGNMLDGGYREDECGLTMTENKNKNGDILYRAYHEGDTEYTYEEAKELETEMLVVSYWDGNNWKTDLIESEQLGNIHQVEIEQLENPEPAFYFRYQLKFNNEKIIATTSNMSGSISPYYEEEIN